MSLAASFRILVVDDFERWRRFTSKTLEKQPGLQIISEASDGLQAVQQAQELQPDLILLDIGLPAMHGIDAARRIRKLSPASKILFVSDNRSAEIVERALSTGATGYVVKSDAPGDLLPAVNAVLGGETFVSTSLSANNLSTHPPSAARPRSDNVVIFTPPQPASARHHDVVFYSDDRHLLDNVTQFVGAALEAGNAAIVVATKAHLDYLLPSLQAYGVDISAVIKQGRYIATDAAETIAPFVVNGRLDSVRLRDTVGHLILAAAKTARGEHPRVVVFGEGAYLLWAQGNVEAAIEDERVCNQLVKMYDIDILCGYCLAFSLNGMESHIYQRICEEHSRVYSQ